MAVPTGIASLPVVGGPPRSIAAVADIGINELRSLSMCDQLVFRDLTFEDLLGLLQ